MEFITLPVDTLKQMFSEVLTKQDEINKRLDLISKAKVGIASNEDQYKTVEEIAGMFRVQKQTIRKALIDYSTEIEVLQNGKGGKQLVNFTHYRKVFGNQVST